MFLTKRSCPRRNNHEKNARSSILGSNSLVSVLARIFKRPNKARSTPRLVTFKFFDEQPGFFHTRVPSPGKNNTDFDTQSLEACALSSRRIMGTCIIILAADSQIVVFVSWSRSISGELCIPLVYWQNSNILSRDKHSLLFVESITLTKSFD